jgi:hypothetical protein
MTRAGRGAVACIVWGCLAPPSPAFAVRARTVPAGAAAAKVARLIRRDARLQIRRFARAVTVTERCCAVRVLRVHYHARAASGQRDAYVLRLETKSGVLTSVSLSERSSGTSHEAEDKTTRFRLDSEFTIMRARSGGRGAWLFSAETSEISSTTGGPGPQTGLGFSDGCGSPAGPMPLGLYRRTLTSLGRAKRHIPAAFAGLATSACKTLPR